MTRLERKIKELIECIYQCEFKGKVEVKEYPDAYALRLSLNQDERPIFITYQCDENDFIKNIADELRKRRLSNTEYYTGVKYEQGEDY
jgi:hypothetical protein